MSKLTHGTQLVESIGSIKLKLQEDLSHRFKNYKSHINDLEVVIDRNTKLIKDLTETIHDKNIENQSLMNEEKIS